MSQEYLNSFNSGELSPYIAGRADIDKYHTGCYKLENMYVLPYGGVERRSGTEYLTDAISEDVKLIPFSFTEDNSYVIEIGVHEISGGLIRVHDKDGYTGVELPSPYEVGDLDTIKYRRIFDVIYLSCPTKPVYTLSRTKLSPLTFEIEELEFIYPPFLEENSDINRFVAPEPTFWLSGETYSSGDQVQISGDYYIANTTTTSGSFIGGEWNTLYQESIDVDTGQDIVLTATVPSGDDIVVFTEDMEGAYWRMRHARTESRSVDAGTLYFQNETSNEVLVDGISYTVNITNEAKKILRTFYIATCVIEGNTGGGWYTKATYNSKGTFVYTGTGAANERIRIRKTDADPVISTQPKTWYNIGLDSNRRVSGSAVADGTSDVLDVSFSNWQVNTGGTWTGTIELEKSTDGGATWNTDIIVGDTQGTDPQNFIVNSPAKEIGNTYIRIKYTHGSGTLIYNINVQSSFSEGLCILTNYISPTQMEATVVNKFGSTAPTYRWTEGAFSNRRGFPNAIDIFEERLTFAGTEYDPSTIWMSIVGDYVNFQLGTDADEAIKITPSTAEPTEWLLSRNTIFQGSRGGLNNILSVDDRSPIYPTNIKSSEVTSYGSAPIQGIFANDVAVYFQRLGKKLRSIEYNDTSQTFTSQDLTILASHITESGISEMTYQKTPDQIIWCLREDGKVAALTFERIEEVIGWHYHDFGGDVKSIAIRPSSGEDELWMAITRTNGTFIEKSSSREFADDLIDAWYVDSGISYDVQAGNYTIESVDVYDPVDFSITITSTNHGLSNGDSIQMITNYSYFDDRIFKISDVTTDTFKLKDSEEVGYIESIYITPESTPSAFYAYNAGTTAVTGEYILSGYDPTFGTPNYYQISGSYDVQFSSPWWDFSAGGIPPYISSPVTTPTYPPIDGWATYIGGSNPPVKIIYDMPLSGSFVKKQNIWTGLDHLEGETVQVLGDGGYEGEFIVSGGQVETEAYYNNVIIGLPYVSVLQPMFIEPTGYPATGKRKSISDVVVKFYKTVGGLVGTRNPKTVGDDVVIDSNIFKIGIPDSEKENLDEYHSEAVNLRETEDILGSSVTPFTGSRLVYINDNWSRLKDIYVVQNTPLPMTVLNMTVNVQVGSKI